MFMASTQDFKTRFSRLRFDLVDDQHLFGVWISDTGSSEQISDRDNLRDLVQGWCDAVDYLNDVQGDEPDGDLERVADKRERWLHGALEDADTLQGRLELVDAAGWQLLPDDDGRLPALRLERELNSLSERVEEAVGLRLRGDISADDLAGLDSSDDVPDRYIAAAVLDDAAVLTLLAADSNPAFAARAARTLKENGPG